MFPTSHFDAGEMHERACKAIAVLGRTQREIAILMGIDVSVPPHERTSPKPTVQNIRKVAQFLGVSVKWLTTGIPETQIDFIVCRPVMALYGQNIVTGNNGSSITVRNTGG